MKTGALKILFNFIFFLLPRIKEECSRMTRMVMPSDNNCTILLVRPVKLTHMARFLFGFTDVLRSAMNPDGSWDLLQQSIQCSIIPFIKYEDVFLPKTSFPTCK